MLLAGCGAVTGTVHAMTMLREGLLEGRAVALAGGVSPSIRDALSALGARLDADPAQALVYDAGPAFADGGQDRLRESIEQAWVAVHDVATGALIPAGAGKVVLIGPTPDSGPFADAARAALENLARTLSVEWARYGVGTVAITRGASTTDDEVAELVCFLVSPAGEYFTGCVFDLNTLIRSS
jgi:NAD(P)-dependent dehydrogenase (short-subunit alcohol dehydrogenase family)